MGSKPTPEGVWGVRDQHRGPTRRSGSTSCVGRRCTWWRRNHGGTAQRDRFVRRSQKIVIICPRAASGGIVVVVIRACTPKSGMSALSGGLNRSPQHSILKGKGVYGDGARRFSRLYGGREDRALGSLAK